MLTRSEPGFPRKHLDLGGAPGASWLLGKERQKRHRPEAEAGRVSPQSALADPHAIRSFIHQTRAACGRHWAGRRVQDRSLGPTRESVSDLDTQGLDRKCPAAPVRVSSVPPWNRPRGLGAFGGRPALPAPARGLAPAERAGRGKQSRAGLRHLIQFVLPGLKYEMVASQTFKARRRESERLLKFKFSWK